MESVEREPILKLFERNDFLKICAPMVRYSKLPFRHLVRRYGVDLCYSPMILANSFVRSEEARKADFSTDPVDQPLIVQFASSDPCDLAQAAQLLYPYAGGIDLNCGCPQRWAMQECLGAHLISKPELIAAMVNQTRNALPSTDFTVSIKIRIHSDLRRTVDLCQKAQASGVSFLTVHGRTAAQRHEPVDTEVFSLIVDSLSIPVVANGDIFTLEGAKQLVADTRVSGVMAARGILDNPAMFAGFTSTPASCIKDWVDLSVKHGVNYSQFHHHLMFMMEKHLSRSEKQIFNRLQSFPAVEDFLRDFLDD